MFARLGVTISAIALFSGCINAQLRKNSLGECQAIGDVYQQQVLNNLAKFAYDANSMPFFSYASGMSSQVQNTAQGTINPQLGFPSGFKTLTFSSLSVSGQGTNLNNETFNLLPVNDPRKLELMRCAYQKAVAPYNGRDMSQSCPDCKSRLNGFYVGDKDGDISAKAGGVVTTECFSKSCWFHVGCKKNLPKHCDCLAVGEYCGLYVWVDKSGRDELTKLTLAILDFAQNSPPTPMNKQVVYYIDQNGLPTTQREAVATVTANVKYDERPESLIYMDPKIAAGLEQSLISQLEGLNKEIMRVGALPEAQNKEQVREALRSLLDQRRVLEGKLEFLKRQLDAGALKNPYVPREPAGPPFGILDLKTQLQGLSPLTIPGNQ